MGNDAVNSDIRLHCTFKGHRKRLRLGAWLGDKATDYLIDLWLSAAQERPLGILTGWDEKDIACAGGYPLDAKRFVEALTDCKLLELKDGVYRLHDWEEHQPWAVGAKERSELARRAGLASAKSRERQRNVNGQLTECSTPSPSPSLRSSKELLSIYGGEFSLKYPGVDLEHEIEKCWTYWEPKDKDSKKKRNWKLRLINWLDTAAKRQTNGRVPGVYTRPEDLGVKYE